MSILLKGYVLVSVVAYWMPKSTAADNFFAVAHQVNDARTARWALEAGANAVEMDMQFDGNSGRPTRFYHGSPCDCSCMTDSYDNVCRHSQACGSSSDVEEQLRFLLDYPSLALIYIDSKTGSLSGNVIQQAGREVVSTLETNLFAMGYRGKVLIGSPSQQYIRSAVSEASGSPYASNFYFTYDDGLSIWTSISSVGTYKTDAVNNLRFLKELLTPNVVYNVGQSACSPLHFLNEVKLGGLNMDRGVISNVFTWTLDKESSFNSYYDNGARGILTNAVPRLIQWARSRGLPLATPGDNSLAPATAPASIIVTPVK